MNESTAQPANGTPTTWTPAPVPPFHLFAARDLVILCVGPGGGSYAGDPAAEDDFIASVEKAIAAGAS